MNLLSAADKITLLKNLLADPDDWISREILSIAYEAGCLQKPLGKSGIG
jgi:hypothetical protein